MYELDTHHFIVKVWLETLATDTDPATWRGHITHVASGDRRYVASLADINNYIQIYLNKMGVNNAIE